MQETFHLVVLTPYARYLEGDATFLNVRSEDYDLGIYPGHTPLISTVSICKMIIRFGKEQYIYAVGGGIINIEKEKITLILNSVERSDEIDIGRAEDAKKRAEDRLKVSSEEVDVQRAKLALLRALNRLNVSNSNN